MVTQANNILIINQIASLFCKNDLICRSNVKNRMINYLTDEILNLVVANLNQGRFYILKVDQINPAGATSFNLNVSYTDLITGATGAGQIRSIPGAWISNNDFYRILQQVNLDLLSSVDVNGVKYYIVQNKNVESYNLVYVPVSVGGTTTGGGSNTTGGGSNTTGGGSNTTGGGLVSGTGQILVKHNDPVISQPVQQTQPETKTSFLDFDFKTLIIPGLVVLGFLLIKK